MWRGAEYEHRGYFRVDSQCGFHMRTIIKGWALGRFKKKRGVILRDWIHVLARLFSRCRCLSGLVVSTDFEIGASAVDDMPIHTSGHGALEWPLPRCSGSADGENALEIPARLRHGWIMRSSAELSTSVGTCFSTCMSSSTRNKIGTFVLTILLGPAPNMWVETGDMREERASYTSLLLKTATGMSPCRPQSRIGFGYPHPAT